jgi:type VI protein secretion system component VasK
MKPRKNEYGLTLFMIFLAGIFVWKLGVPGVKWLGDHWLLVLGWIGIMLGLLLLVWICTRLEDRFKRRRRDRERKQAQAAERRAVLQRKAAEDTKPLVPPTDINEFRRQFGEAPSHPRERKD